MAYNPGEVKIHRFLLFYKLKKQSKDTILVDHSCNNVFALKPMIVNRYLKNLWSKYNLALINCLMFKNFCIFFL